MKKKYRKNQKELLETYSIALENVGKQEEIAALMSDLGYDNSVIDEGRKLLLNTKSIFEKKNCRGCGYFHCFTSYHSIALMVQ